MNNHLFLFTLGPVQSFIAQARKTQDLYAGSQILSNLVRAGIDAFEKEFPNDKIIFPCFDRNQEDVSLPNRFIGRVEGDESILIEKAKAIQRVVEQKFWTISVESLHRAKKSSFVAFEAQIQSHLDIHWVFQAIEIDFATTYRKLENLGGAIKNVRVFQQYEYASCTGEKGRKCSIDGVNNALFYGAKGGAKAPAFMENGEAIDCFMLNPGEGLSAVSLVKRFYDKTDWFPSTAEIALMHDLNKISEEKRWLLGCYRNLFDKDLLMVTCLELINEDCIKNINIPNPANAPNWHDQFDFQMLFEESLNAKNIPNLDQLTLLQQLLPKLKSELKTKYYALVMFDGDQMGKWLSGENNISKDNLEDFHRILSGVLSDFGAKAKTYLNDNQRGHTVYAGGDDFLGFVNLHHLFEVMQYFRECFDQIVNESITGFKKPDQGITFSAGIVIAHYKTPFSEVLKKAREIEKKAKNEGGRNAFGLTVLKHSGEIQEMIYKWDSDENSFVGCKNWAALAHIVKELNQEEGAFSNKFIQNLTVEFSQLTGTDLQNINFRERSNRPLEQALLLEIERLTARSFDKPVAPEKDSQRKRHLVEAVQTLWKVAPHENKTRHFIHALQIADFLTRKTKQA